MGKLEQLYGPMIKGIPTLQASLKGATNNWVGLTTIASNAASVQVNCTLVQSDSVITVTPGPVVVASGFAKHIGVQSIAPGSYFIIGTMDNKAMDSSVAVPVSYVVWRIK